MHKKEKLFFLNSRMPVNKHGVNDSLENYCLLINSYIDSGKKYQWMLKLESKR